MEVFNWIGVSGSLIFAIACGFNFIPVDTERDIIDRTTVTILWLVVFAVNLAGIIG